jgi:AP-1-like transcription factor
MFMLLCGHTSSNNQQRRRAQNRASQRAYRERRERHVKSLEEKLEVINSQHEELSKEYAQLRIEHMTELWKMQNAGEQIS